MSTDTPPERVSLLRRLALLLVLLRELRTAAGRRRARVRMRRAIRRARPYRGPVVAAASAARQPAAWRPHELAERLARRARRGEGEHRPGSSSGGLAVRERYGADFYSSIGALGGTTVLEERGVEYLHDIGARGGAATRQRYGREHYAEIGRKGGQAGRGRKRRRQRPGQLEIWPEYAEPASTRPSAEPAAGGAPSELPLQG